MQLPELLAPAGSFAGVRAAVQSGATAVYMGFGTFNARRGAKNFSRTEMAEAIRYCRERGVKTNITLNILVLDREFPDVLADVRFLNEAGADALIVQDLGLARRIRACAPDLPLHASTQMTVHTLDGARFAASLGFSRVVLSRECTLAQIHEITAKAGIETEVFVHGALCMCYSGQCYMSAMIGQRSGNRGLCAQPCRLPYIDEAGKHSYPLSLKDLCLAGWLSPLVDAGVSSLKIEGRMKRPEYAAIVTEIYARLLREGRRPTDEELSMLRQVFSRDGFTDGYLTGKKGAAMFGTKTDIPMDAVKPLYDQAARRFAEDKEAPLVAVDMHCVISVQGIVLTVHDREGNRIQVRDQDLVEPASGRPAAPEQVERNLRKSGGTPFDVRMVTLDLPEGLMISASRINALRRDALEQLLMVRGQPPVRRWTHAAAPTRANIAVQPFKGYTLEVRELSQITQAMLHMPPETIYAPLAVLAGNLQNVHELCVRGIQIAPVLPRIFSDDEQPEIVSMLSTLQKAGVHAAAAGTVGQIQMLHSCGMTAYGDFGLNICNSDALSAVGDCGVQRQTLSFELRFAQIRDLQKQIDTEIIAYGYLPLMVVENCAIQQKNGKCTCKESITYLTDRTGKRFALLPEHGCRNTLLNSQPLYLGDKPEAYQHLDVSYARLRFTTESSARCEEVYMAHVHGTKLDFSQEKTRGLYYRGVE